MDQIDLTGMTVAVVDDNRNFLRLMRTILRSFNVGYVYESEDARTTLQCLRTQQVDVLLTDHMMPIINGFELIQTIRSDPRMRQPELPIICVSGQADRATVENAIRVGADDFLVKPIRPIDVFRRLVRQMTNPLPRISAPKYRGPDRRRGLRNNHGGGERRSERDRDIVEI